MQEATDHVQTLSFAIGRPRFDAKTGIAEFPYGLGDLSFTETLAFPSGFDAVIAASPHFVRLLGLTALVLGTSYFKLKAPFAIQAPDIALNAAERAFVIDVYENGLGEFYARNNLRRFGLITLDAASASNETPPLRLPARTLLPIGGGKDSLVSVQILEKAGIKFTPFAVNPKGPILTSVTAIGKPPLYVSRTLDPEMIRLGTMPDYYNGHVPSTAIISMIAALGALLFGYDTIALSNERSASEGNVTFDGREANHQHSKSIGFERAIATILKHATSGALTYYSVLRPFSEARIAALFARENLFDRVFSSCNRNFRLAGHEGDLWCGTCPKCHFTFLVLAPQMDKSRLVTIFGQNLLAKPENETPYRELTGLAGQKPWECVGEILEAAACLWALTEHADWQNDAIVKTLRADLLSQYGRESLEAAFAALFTDSSDHLIPPDIFQKLAQHAL